MDQILDTGNASYARRVLLVCLLVFGAFVVNSVAGRLLGIFKRFVARMVFAEPEASIFVMNAAFDLANLTFTAVLAWNLHDLSLWILEEWMIREDTFVTRSQLACCYKVGAYEIYSRRQWRRYLVLWGCGFGRNIPDSRGFRSKVWQYESQG